MNGEGTLDDLYIEWLYTNFVGSVENMNPERSFWNLTRRLYSIPFTWSIDDDANRAEAGKELRQQFIIDCNVDDIEIGWLQLDCSVLEMMAGLACGCSFESLGTPGDWFWKFLENLGLSSYNDRIYNSTHEAEVDAVVKRLLDRTYERNGEGGLFPCKHATRDQTQINLWYQAQGYLLEDDRFERGP